MNEEIFRRLSDMLDSNNVMSNMTSNSYSKAKHTDYNFGSNFSNNSDMNNFDFSKLDIETVMKIKNIMNKMNSNSHSPRANLLMSLKPYLKPSRKNMLDQYIQFENISSALKGFNDFNATNNKENKDGGMK